MDEPETLLSAADDFFAWLRPKPGMSIFGAHVGRLLLSSRRLLFLSTGTSGAGRAALTAAIGGPILSMTIGRTRTDELDLGALQNEGSLAVPLLETTSLEVRRRWDLANYLTLVTTAAQDLPPAVAFMTKVGFNRGVLERFKAEYDKARALLSSTPYR